jgi:CheY-like chemotaxis protein
VPEFRKTAAFLGAGSPRFGGFRGLLSRTKTRRLVASGTSIAEAVPMRVLIVEDERRMANYIGRALVEEAFAVDTACDGLRALELARTYEYDAIVLDVMLPGLDGISVCRELRSERRQVPVLIVSARDMIEDRVRGLDAGADDYLVKPFALSSSPRDSAPCSVGGRRRASASRSPSARWRSIPRRVP